MQADNEILNLFISRNVILATLQIASLFIADFWSFILKLSYKNKMFGNWYGNLRLK